MQVPSPLTSAKSVHHLKEISASSLKIPHVPVHHINSEGQTQTNYGILASGKMVDGHQLLIIMQPPSF